MEHTQEPIPAMEALVLVLEGGDTEHILNSLNALHEPDDPLFNRLTRAISKRLVELGQT